MIPTEGAMRRPTAFFAGRLASVSRLAEVRTHRYDVY